MSTDTAARAATMTSDAARDLDDALARLVAQADSIRATLADGYVSLGADGYLADAAKVARKAAESYRSVETVSTGVDGFGAVERAEAVKRGAARSRRARGE